MGTQGKNAPNNLSKQLGLQMKGSPYSMNQPLHGNAFIGAKVKAEQQGKNSFDVGGETFQVKKSAAPKFIGALIGGLGAKVIGGAVAKGVGKSLVSKVGGSIVKQGMKDVASGGLKNAISSSGVSDMSSLVKDVAVTPPKGKTGMGKALSAVGGAIGGAAKTAVSGIGEGIGGVAEGLKEKVGGGGKGAFKEKVKNYIGSLDLITNSNPDGSLRKPGDKKDNTAEAEPEETALSKVNTQDTAGVKTPLVPEQYAKLDTRTTTASDSIYNVSIDKGANKNRLLDTLTQPRMEGPLNKIKNMCRG